VVLVIVALAFLANAGLGVYHAGAEWKFWPGPDTCAAPSAATATNAKDLLKGLDAVTVIRCDEAAGRFAGLSFAGWNVLLSIALCAGALLAAFASLRRRAQ